MNKLQDRQKDDCSEVNFIADGFYTEIDGEFGIKTDILMDGAGQMDFFLIS